VTAQALGLRLFAEDASASADVATDKRIAKRGQCVVLGPR